MKRILRIIRNTILGLLLVSVLSGALAYFLWVQPEYRKLKEIAYDKLAGAKLADMTRLRDTVIYDSEGEKLGVINAGHFVYVEIQDISRTLQDAYIAQEDRNFKFHKGVDYKASLRAGLSLIKNKGKITQGGSTITQQLVKNTYLSAEKSFRRKFTEMILAREIEKMYSKAKIMELYCNNNFYGNNCYGVEAASQFYFGKSAKELTFPEAATLVGISNAPSRYEPLRHSEASLRKRNQVLRSLLDCENITKEEYQAYIQEPLHIQAEAREETDEDYLNSYAFHEAVLRLMGLHQFRFEYLWDNKEKQAAYQERFAESYELYSNELRRGGYELYTSLNPKLQEVLQEKLDEGLSSFTELQENGKPALQGAISLVDNESGLVVAMVGGRGREDRYNRAFLSNRQPGSSIKPLLDYAPAMENGKYSPGTLIDDHQFEGGPANSGNHYFGMVSLREAVNRSLNTVAWQVLEDIGLPYGLGFLEKMKFQGLDWRDLSAKAISIGGFTKGVTTENMARGYASLANGGMFRNDSCILKIVHEREGEITKGQDLGEERIYSEDTAYMMTDVLKDSIRKPYGTGRMLALAGGMPCAGKTGTTNNSKDTWFCGYTRYYTMAVWVGYDTPRAMPGVYGATYAGSIWQNAMNRLHEGLEPLDWERPENVVESMAGQSGVKDLVSLRFSNKNKKSSGFRGSQEEGAFSGEVIEESESEEILEVGPGIDMRASSDDSLPASGEEPGLPQTVTPETASLPLESSVQTIPEIEAKGMETKAPVPTSAPVPTTQAVPPTTQAPVQTSPEPTSPASTMPPAGNTDEENAVFPGDMDLEEEEEEDYEEDEEEEDYGLVERNPGFLYPY